jgi:UTP--glucose-1-phosphate uridylyltransferase
MSQSVRFAVLPVAGLGTRFLPATKSIPKEMLPVVDRPLVAYAVEDAYRAGIRTFVFITSRSKKAVEDFFDRNNEVHAELEAAGKHELLEVLRRSCPPDANFVFVRQPQPRGLGHAVYCAEPIVRDEPFAVLLPDELMVSEPWQSSATQELVSAFNRTGADTIGVIRVPKEATKQYGIVAPKIDLGSIGADGFELADMVEKPTQNAPSQYAAIGRYVFGRGFMCRLAHLEAGQGGEIQLTDAIALKARSGGPVRALPLKATRFDCGSKLGFLQATVHMALAREDLGPAFQAWLESRMNSQMAA